MENTKSVLAEEHRLWLEENYSRMYAFALSQLHDRCSAEDAVCDAAAVVIAKYGTLRGDFSPWAWGVLRKIILRAGRADLRRRREEDIDSHTEVLADMTLPPAENLIMAHERGQVRRVLSMMPADLRRVLEERYIGEKSYCWLADSINAPSTSLNSFSPMISLIPTSRSGLNDQNPKALNETFGKYSLKTSCF